LSSLTLEQKWLLHTRSDIVHRAFPRDACYPFEESMKRFTVLTAGQYVTFCNLCRRSNSSAHVSVYSQVEWETKNASCLWFDIDGKDVLDSSSFVNKFLPFLEVFKPTVVYTGGKGFQIFLSFPLTKIMDLRGATMFFLRGLDGLEWEPYIDKRKIGDWRSICRVPETPHRKTKKPSEILRYGYITDFGVSLASVLEKKFGSGIVYAEEAKSKEGSKSENMIEYIGFPPCIQKLLSMTKTGEMDHEERIQLSIFLMKWGFSQEEVKFLFSKMSDYRESTTDYQLSYLNERQIRLYSCRKSIELGICPIPKGHCRYFPSLNWIFKW